MHGPVSDEPMIRVAGNQGRYYPPRPGQRAGDDRGHGRPGGAEAIRCQGNVLKDTGSVAQYGYTGHEPDATMLVYDRARYDDPSIGRCISRDPAGMPDGVNR